MTQAPHAREGVWSALNPEVAAFDVQKDLGFLKTNIDAQRFVDLSLIEEAGKRLK